jgi:hypothetical protein
MIRRLRSTFGALSAQQSSITIGLVAIRADAAAAPRTVTIRVRRLIIAAIVLGFLAILVFAGHWATSLQPLSTGNSDAGPEGLGVAQAATQTGPAVYRWTRNGTYVLTFGMVNSASVPITITGVESTPSPWDGQFTGPTLGIPTDPANLGLAYTAFHATTIPAGGTRPLTFVFHANPRACRYPGGPGSVGSTDSITVRFTTLGVVHDSETIPLGDLAFYLASPTRATCS